MSRVQLRRTLAPVLLRVHPDVFNPQHMKNNNEASFKNLNTFLDIAQKGCNGLQVMPSSLLQYQLKFHYLDDQGQTQVFDSKFQIPRHLTTPTADPNGNRKQLWRKFTNSCVCELFDGLQLSYPTPPPLIPFQHQTINIAKKNRLQQKRSNRDHFRKTFNRVIQQDDDLVSRPTTGMEEGTAEQHRILTKLLRKRVFYDPSWTSDQKRKAFRKLAALLLRNFYCLQLHKLAWNRVALRLSDDSEFQILFMENGAAITLPIRADQEQVLEYLQTQILAVEEHLDQD